MAKKCEKCGKKFQFREKKTYADFGEGRILLCEDCLKDENAQFIKNAPHVKPFDENDFPTIHKRIVSADNKNNSFYGVFYSKNFENNKMEYYFFYGHIFSKNEIENNSEQSLAELDVNRFPKDIQLKFDEMKKEELDVTINDIKEFLKAFDYPFAYFQEQNHYYTIESIVHPRDFIKEVENNQYQAIHDQLLIFLNECQSNKILIDENHDFNKYIEKYPLISDFEDGFKTKNKSRFNGQTTLSSDILKRLADINFNISISHPELTIDYSCIKSKDNTNSQLNEYVTYTGCRTISFPNNMTLTSSIMHSERMDEDDLIKEISRKTNKKQTTLIFKVPPVKKENINLHTTKNTIKIEILATKQKYLKTIHIEQKIKPKQIKASYEGGLLTIILNRP